MFKFSIKIGSNLFISETGELPLGYIAWLVYAIFLAARVAVIFKQIAYRLTESEDFFGPNTLKSAVALACVVFFLLIMTHADTPPRSAREYYIQNLSLHVTLDILDTVNILDVLFLEESHVFLSFELHNSIIAISCINLILPTIPLIVLSYTRYGKDELTHSITTIHTIVYFICVNLPYLVIRLVLWHVHSQNVSVFVIKNVLGLGATFKTVHDHLIQLHEDEEENKENEELAMEEVERSKRKEQEL